MMTRIVFLFAIILFLVTCQRPTTNDQPRQSSDATRPEEAGPEAVVTDEMAEAEREAQIAMELAEQEFGFILEGSIRPGELPQGTWFDQNGSRICDGFLTRNVNEDYCAAVVPGDWVPFEFNGQTYYMQPLSESGE